MSCHIISDKPLAFFSGHECGNMPFDLQFCDHMVEQIPPTSTWGTEFYTASLMTRSLDRFQALSSRDDNSIMRNCTGDTIISDERSLPTAGEISASRFCRFTSRYPVLLVQFSVGGGESPLGDPSMTIIPPAGQYKDSYVLNYFTGQSASNSVNIILLSTPQVFTNGTLLNGNSINGSLTNIFGDLENNTLCAYGV